MPDSLRALTSEPVSGVSGTTRQCSYLVEAIY